MFKSNDERPERIYLDHNATTPLSARVREAIINHLDSWGNPSSIHIDSRAPKTILRETRKLFAEIFKCSPLELIFNSGASEGNNTVLKSVWAKYQLEKNEYIISSVEHPSVTKSAQYLESLGAVIHWIPVSRSGQLDLNFVKHKISNKTALISCMFANNETGTLFPIKELAQMAEQNQILFHVDCVQALGKADLSLAEQKIDYATFSAHKFYALKGCGLLYVRKGAPLTNLIHGGGQERARRGGTENVLAVAALQASLQNYGLLSSKKQFIENLRNEMEKSILSTISGVQITAAESPRLANTSSLVIPGVDGETLLMSLDLKGFSVSTGAACSSGNPEPSPVLLAIGLSREEAQCSLRISLGWETTEDQIQSFIKILSEVVERIRLANSFSLNSENKVV